MIIYKIFLLFLINILKKIKIIFFLNIKDEFNICKYMNLFLFIIHINFNNIDFIVLLSSLRIFPLY